jgi:hypothetical protein
LEGKSRKRQEKRLDVTYLSEKSANMLGIVVKILPSKNIMPHNNLT